MSSVILNTPLPVFTSSETSSLSYQLWIINILIQPSYGTILRQLVPLFFGKAPSDSPIM
jgi:hypothetical protein